MRILCLFIVILLNSLTFTTKGQDRDSARIDLMLVRGEYAKVVDTCKQILGTDSSNAAIWYKMGLAQQNMMPDTGSFSCFLKASGFAPENRLYKFTVAKNYFNKNKYFKAKPIFEELCKADSANWNYAYYLTGIYISEGKYNKAIDIYNTFYKNDSANFVILDKLGFAYLRLEDYETAIDYYNHSLALNKKNIDAIRNLSFLYPFVNNRDTAITLLTRAIEMEPEDIDLYARRGTIYFSKNYNKRALNDYLKILGLGDSSALYLKRAGIGYMNNLQPGVALPYLLKANSRDTTDFETLDYIAQCYYRLNDHKKSAFWYNKLITSLKGFQAPLAMAYLSLAREQKTSSLYHEAIGSFSRAYKITEFQYILIYIANIYDENLNDLPEALNYYNQFLALFRGKKLGEAGLYSASYVESVKKRVDYLDGKIAEEKAKKAYSAQPK